MDSKANIENIYTLSGKVPILKSIPFGLQHVLAMFVSNLVPIIIVLGAAGLGGNEALKAMLLQNCMFIAGVGTLIQLFPIWRIGSKLPVVMGVSFTFVTALCLIAATKGYATAIGAVIIGGILEGLLGLTAKYWRKIISPLVSACVVTTIGFSLLKVGAASFAGGFGPNLGNSKHLLVGFITLVALILFNIFAKGVRKQLSVFFGLIVGYIAALIFGIVDFSAFNDIRIISLPKFFPIKPVFDISAIIAVFIIFIVSATETIGDTSACVNMGLGREPTEKEISGSVACDGFLSSVSGCFGCLPITSFSQNVGIIAMTKVVNRYAIATGAIALVLAGLFPPIGAFFATLPEAVIGGCTIMLFGQIVASGMRMIANVGFSQRNIIIISLSLACGLGFTAIPDTLQSLPAFIRNIGVTQNEVAIVFIISLLLDLVLPKNMGIERKPVDEEEVSEALVETMGEMDSED